MLVENKQQIIERNEKILEDALKSLKEHLSSTEGKEACSIFAKSIRIKAESLCH